MTVQAADPQKTALFEGFADLFAATISAEGEVSETRGQEVSALPGGNELPEPAGKDLPVVAAALPLANVELAAPTILPAGQDDTPPVTAAPRPALVQSKTPAKPDDAHEPPALVSDNPLPSRATPVLTAAPAVPQVGHSAVQRETASGRTAPMGPMETVEIQISAPQSTPKTDGQHAERAHASQVGVPQVVAPSLSIAKVSMPVRSLPIPLTGTELATVEGQVSLDTATKPTANAHEAKLMPVAQLLRPVAARAQVQGEMPENGQTTTAEVAPQRPAVIAPSTQPALPAIPAQPTADAMRPAPTPAASDTAQPTPSAPQRHDFGQVVERLAEAREMARPGRAEMQVVHREFGQVSMQFDITGGALKVALANAHAGFAPAVQAALAERPVTPASEATLRTDIPAQQQSQATAQTTVTPHAATSHWQGDTQHQRHHETPRQAGVQAQTREQTEARESDATRRAERGRDNALFA